ncbi:MAG: hypothetical protein AAF581_13940 [Planctomycetota bacterium]
MYRTLEASCLVETAQALHLRIVERFPNAGLGGVAREVAEVSQEARERCREIRRTNVPLRIGSILISVAAVSFIVLLIYRARFTSDMWLIENLLEEVDAALGSVVFLGAAIIFLVSTETRLKRRKSLVAVNELRAFAHIIDMHQLTKDPEPITRCKPTEHSPERTMTPFELGRYFDYCSELLSIVAKVGALYVQAFPDPVTLNAVDDLENLCTGLSRKIWQKATLIDRLTKSSD